MSRLFIIGIIVFVLLLGIMLISALTSDEQNALQNELNLLEQNLSGDGYGWFANYSINYTQVEGLISASVEGKSYIN